MPRPWVATWCVVLIWVLTPLAFAQSPQPDSFNPQIDGAVTGFALQPDGKILVGGWFPMPGGQPDKYLIRLNGDGTLDTGFNPEANATVRSIMVQANGKIVVAEQFATLGGQPRSLARLNADGKLDSDFSPQVPAAVYCLAVQDDGKIVIGGSSRTYYWDPNIAPYRGLSRLNADGTFDTSFQPPVSGYFNAVAVQTDGKILVGGDFSVSGQQSRRYMARLNADGTLDEAFNPGANNPVSLLQVQTDEKILVGGAFTMIGGGVHPNFARLNANGTLDTQFNPSPNDQVESLTLQADGKILIGGRFTKVAGQPVTYVARLNRAGTLDSSFKPTLNAPVTAMALQTDGAILLGGNFSTIGSESRKYIARLRNTELATDSLRHEGSAILWQRSSTSPEVRCAIFDLSTNGVDWVRLGAGTRTLGGWQLAGVTIPEWSTVRARGFVESAGNCSSSWAVERMMGMPVPLADQIHWVYDAGTRILLSVFPGDGQFSFFHWFKDGEIIPDDHIFRGAQTSTLIIDSAVKTVEGTYTVEASNALGRVVYAVARIQVNDPVITTPPQSQVMHVGESNALCVVSAGTLPLNYQWWKNDVPLAGATNCLLPFPVVQDGDSGNYWVVVSNAFGSVTSSVAQLRVNHATVDNSFNPDANQRVLSLAMQADGKILVGGGFTSLCGQPRNRIARINADGTLDSSFKLEANFWVRTLGIQNDGKILMGGDFTTLNGQPHNGIARLNPNGTLDGNFKPTANKGVYSMAALPDGKIMIGGGFTMLNGQPRKCLARLNSDGSLDSGFNVGAARSSNAIVLTLALQHDGKILVGGQFTTLGGQSRSNLARLNANGTIDSSFNPEIYGAVSSVAVQPNGKLIIAGGFVKVGGQTRFYLARLNMDGTLDGSFNPQLNRWVDSLAVQTDGKILVGGEFTTLNGQLRIGLGRLHADGTLDERFNPDPGGSTRVSIEALMLQPDGRLLVGGEFTRLGGQPHHYLARINNTDPATESLSHNSSTITWLRGGSSPEVWRTAFAYSTNRTNWINLGKGTRILGGWQLPGVKIPRHATLRARGYVTGGNFNNSSWFVESLAGMPAIVGHPASRTNNAGTVATFSVSPTKVKPLFFQWRRNGTALHDGNSIIGAQTATLTLSNVFKGEEGRYTVVVSNTFGCVTSRVATLTVGEPLITSHPTNQFCNAGEQVAFHVIAIGTPPLNYQWQKNGVTLAGATEPTLTLANAQGADAGNYRVVVRSAFGSVTSAVARLAVNLVTVNSNFNAVANETITAVAVQMDGQMIIGGRFTVVNGYSRQHIARLHPIGMLDYSFKPDADAEVFALALQPGGKILVGGAFTTLCGQPRNRIARLNPDGTLDETFNPGADETVVALLVQPDGKIVAGGNFTMLGGQVRNRIARLNPDGTLDNSFNPGANRNVLSLAAQTDGKIVVGGGFTMLGGQRRERLARLNANGTLDTSFSGGADWTVHCLAMQANGKILVSGGFEKVNGKPRKMFARLNADGSLDTSFAPEPNSHVLSIAVQTDGKIIAGGSFGTMCGQPRQGIARLNANGTLDSTFDFKSGGLVESLAMQWFGNVLVGGGMKLLDGQLYRSLIQLNSTTPPSQSLGYRNGIVTWRRYGSGPEVWSTVFEYTTNETHWISLGKGIRIAGGWQLSGVQIPTPCILRVRGFLSGGYFNGSSSFVEFMMGNGSLFDQPSSGMEGGSSGGVRQESFSSETMEQTPGFENSHVASSVGPSLEIRSTAGGVVLQVSGEVGKRYVLEYTPRLDGPNGWSSLGSVVLTNNPHSFRDGTATHATQRYYRIRESQ